MLHFKMSWAKFRDLPKTVHRVNTMIYINSCVLIARDPRSRIFGPKFGQRTLCESLLTALGNIGIGILYRYWYLASVSVPVWVSWVSIILVAVSSGFQFIAIIFFFMARQYRYEELMKARDQLGISI